MAVYSCGQEYRWCHGNVQLWTKKKCDAMTLELCTFTTKYLHCNSVSKQVYQQQTIMIKICGAVYHKAGNIWLLYWILLADSHLFERFDNCTMHSMTSEGTTKLLLWDDRQAVCKFVARKARTPDNCVVLWHVLILQVHAPLVTDWRTVKNLVSLLMLSLTLGGIFACHYCIVLYLV